MEPPKFPKSNLYLGFPGSAAEGNNYFRSLPNGIGCGGQTFLGITFGNVPFPKSNLYLGSPASAAEGNQGLFQDPPTQNSSWLQDPQTKEQNYLNPEFPHFSSRKILSKERGRTENRESATTNSRCSAESFFPGIFFGGGLGAEQKVLERGRRRELRTPRGRCARNP